MTALCASTRRFRRTDISLRGFAMFALPLSFALPLLFGGCGNNTGGRVPLAGTVTLGGAPLARGSIEFHPAGEGTTTGGTVREGRFAIPAKQGVLPDRYEVRIYAADPSGQPIDDPNVPPGESDRPLRPELLDKRYNLESELTVDIGDGGNNDLAFHLEE